MGKFNFLILLILLVTGVTLVYAQQGQKVDLVPLDFGVKQSITLVNTTATPIPATALSGRKSIMIKNLESVTLYIGSSTVSANTSATGGYPLAQNDVFKGDIGENTIIYGILAAGSGNCSVLEAR